MEDFGAENQKEMDMEHSFMGPTIDTVYGQGEGHASDNHFFFKALAEKIHIPPGVLLWRTL